MKKWMNRRTEAPLPMRTSGGKIDGLRWSSSPGAAVSRMPRRSGGRPFFPGTMMRRLIARRCALHDTIRPILEPLDHHTEKPTRGQRETRPRRMAHKFIKEL